MYGMIVNGIRLWFLIIYGMIMFMYMVYLFNVHGMIDVHDVQLCGMIGL